MERAVGQVKTFGVARKIPGNGKKSERLEGFRGSVDEGGISKVGEAEPQERQKRCLCGEPPRRLGQ